MTAVRLVLREGALTIGDGFDEVLDAARSRAPWGFERLYTDLAPVVTGYLRMHGAAEPDDLASEVFLGVFAGLGSFRGSEAKFRSWVFTIAHRRLTDEWRRSSRRPVVPTDDPLVLDRPGGHVEDEVMEVLGSGRVRELCAELSSDQREVLLLRVVADLTVDQVADVIGKSSGAVKALQRRGLNALRSRLAREGVPL